MHYSNKQATNIVTDILIGGLMWPSVIREGSSILDHFGRAKHSWARLLTVISLKKKSVISLFKKVHLFGEEGACLPWWGSQRKPCRNWFFLSCEFPGTMGKYPYLLRHCAGRPCHIFVSDDKSLLSSWLHMESPEKQAAGHSCEGLFLIWVFESERYILNLCPTFRWQSPTKGHGRRDPCFLPIYPPSCWQFCLPEVPLELPLLNLSGRSELLQRPLKETAFPCISQNSFLRGSPPSLWPWLGSIGPNQPGP